MITFAEIERVALDLPEDQRVMLTNRLLDSLPPGSYDEDEEGIAEAARREAQYAADPSSAITLEELDAAVGYRRGAEAEPAGEGTRRFMRLAGTIQGAADLSTRRGFSKGG